MLLFVGGIKTKKAVLFYINYDIASKKPLYFNVWHKCEKRRLSVVLHSYIEFTDHQAELLGLKVVLHHTQKHTHTFNLLSTELLGFLPHHFGDEDIFLNMPQLDFLWGSRAKRKTDPQVSHMKRGQHNISPCSRLFYIICSCGILSKFIQMLYLSINLRYVYMCWIFSFHWTFYFDSTTLQRDTFFASILFWQLSVLVTFCLILIARSYKIRCCQIF